jgi:hypothetical protein
MPESVTKQQPPRNHKKPFGINTLSLKIYAGTGLDKYSGPQGKFFNGHIYQETTQ